MDKIKLMIAQAVLHKYLPFTYIVQAWDKLTGYRTQVFACLWVLAYELSKYHVGLFGDPEFSKKVLDYLLAGGSATLLEKGKSFLPYIEAGIDAIKTQGEKK